MLLHIKRIVRKKKWGSMLVLPFTAYLKMFARELSCLHTSTGYWLPWYWLQLLCFALPWDNCMSKTSFWKPLCILAWDNSQSWCLLASQGKAFQLNDSFIFSLLSYNSASEKMHANFPYSSKLGKRNEIDIVRNCLADHLQIGSWLWKRWTSWTF